MPLCRVVAVLDAPSPSSLKLRNHGRCPTRFPTPGFTRGGLSCFWRRLGRSLHARRGFLVHATLRAVASRSTTQNRQGSFIGGRRGRRQHQGGQPHNLSRHRETTGLRCGRTRQRHAGSGSIGVSVRVSGCGLSASLVSASPTAAAACNSGASFVLIVRYSLSLSPPRACTSRKFESISLASTWSSPLRPAHLLTSKMEPAVTAITNANNPVAFASGGIAQASRIVSSSTPTRYSPGRI